MKNSLVIVDYGMGNVHNVVNALRHLGAKPLVTGNPEEIRAARALVLPGVGAFGDCVQNLSQNGTGEAVKEQIRRGTPFLGICLGLQALFETSEEADGRGLGVFAGTVDRFKIDLHVPHMGWNTVDFTDQGAKCPLLRGIDSGSYFYFVHSFYANPADKNICAATTQYGLRFTAMVWKDNVFAMQFHPEKSQTKGQKLLKNFLELTA